VACPAVGRDIAQTSKDRIRGATTLTGSLRRFVTGDPATAALGGEPIICGCASDDAFAPIPAIRATTIEPTSSIESVCGILAKLGILSRKNRRPRAPPAPIPPQTVALPPPPQGPAFASHLC
jgi:hypothetical protein